MRGSRQLEFKLQLSSYQDLNIELTISMKLNDAILSSNEFLIPDEALREVINNALIHRKYNINDAIKIALFHDRIEFFSPGNFPGPITNFLSGISYSRNPTIRQLARNIGLVEKRGLGLRKIFESCNKNNNPEPIITDSFGDFVKVTIFYPQTKSSHNIKDWPSELFVFEDLFEMKGDFTLSDAAVLLKCSKNTARKKIDYFMQNKMLEIVGKGKSTRFIWK